MFTGLWPPTAKDLNMSIDDFYEDVFCEIAKIAPIEEMLVASNTAQHLRGNVYVRFRNEMDAEAVLADMKKRWYAHRLVWVELSPVRDVRGACCRQFYTNSCDRGGDCNYVHPFQPRPELVEDLFASQQLTWQNSRYKIRRDC